MISKVQCTMNLRRELRKEFSYYPYFAALVASLAMAETGTTAGWSSPALYYLTSNQLISENESSLIASLDCIGAISGCILSSLIVNRIGRKYTLFLMGFFQLIGWIVLNFARTSFNLYIAKVLMGTGGSSFATTVIYVGEISSKQNRGLLLSLLPFSFYLGFISMTAIGSFFSYHAMNKLGLIVPTIFIILSLFIPETPYFYLMRNRDEQAKQVLMKLEGTKDSMKVKLDLERIKEAVLESQKMEGFALRELVATKGNRKAIFILIGMVAVRQLSGSGPIAAHTHEIFEKSESIMRPEYSAFVFAASKVIASFSTSRIVDLMGRRMTILLSGLAVALSLMTLGVYLFFKLHLKSDITLVSWLPLVTLTFYAFAFAFGFGTVPSVIGGEIFPVNVKGVAVSVGQILESLIRFPVTAGFEKMNKIVNLYGSCWIFATFSAVGSILLFWFTPETKGKNLEEIQEILNGKEIK